MVDDQEIVRAVIVRHAELLEDGDLAPIFSDLMTDDIVFMPSDVEQTVVTGKPAAEEFYRALVERFERHAKVDIAEIEVFELGDGKGAWARTDYREQTTEKPVDENPTQHILGCEFYVLRWSTSGEWRIARLMYSKYVASSDRISGR